MRCKNKFWINNMTDLFCDFSIVPLSHMSLESKCNALTRFTFIIFILLLLILDLKKALIIFVVCLLIIIFFYLIKNKINNKDNNKMKENFTYLQNNSNSNNNCNNEMVYINPPQPPISGKPKNYQRADIVTNPKTGRKDVMFDRPTAFRFCDDEVNFEPNVNNYISINQKLVGPPNPKTLIPPVITPPISDLSYWKTNNIITHSHINDLKQIDNYQSGYKINTTCGNTNSSNNAPNRKNDKLYRYSSVKESTPKTLSDNYKTFSRENFTNNSSENLNGNSRENFTNNSRENFRLPIIQDIPFVKPNQSGYVNTSCGYNVDQLYDAGLPTNYTAGNCQQDPAFKQYNENLFTQTIQPGVYTTDQIIEPINSNIGISFQQQFEPLTMSEQNGNVLYTQHDPRLYTKPLKHYEETVNESNVYDPRLSGYGTSYRAYSDDQLGNTKFYYDDINAVRMPNYITRSKIDTFSYADQYGPVQNQYGNVDNSTIRELADKSWLDNSLSFRTDLQERLMRKNNANAWQQRVAPINTMSQSRPGSKIHGSSFI